jgi:hypothetical protein
MHPARHDGRFFLEQFLDAVSLEMIDSNVAGDLIHPRREAAVRTVCRAVLEYPKEYFLNQIFAQRSVAGHPAKEVEQGRIVLLEKETQLPGVALPH